MKYGKHEWKIPKQCLASVKFQTLMVPPLETPNL